MRKMGIGLGVGINRSNYAQGIFGAYRTRVIADGGIVEAGTCVDAVSSLLQSASLLLIPSGYKSGVAYSEIPTNGNGDLTWSRASTANRTNSSGNIELMGSGVPRLSYMYGSCPALLAEPQRTNLAWQSETFDNATWSKTAVSVTANTTTSPDGNSTADTLTGDGTSSIKNLIQTATSTLTSGVRYCTSVYVKKNTNNFFQIIGTTNAYSSGTFANFDLNNGVVGTIGGSGTEANIVNVGNGWYRCTMIATTNNTTGANIAIFGLITSATSVRAETNTLSTSVYLWGAQLELGAYPTTYIPTTTASATRVADSFSRSNIYTNGLISASGGTWFVELRNNVAVARDAGVNFGLGLFDNTSTNGINIWNVAVAPTSTRMQIRKNISSGGSATIYTTTTDTCKIAIKWNGTSIDVFENGTKVVSASAFAITNMDFLRCSCEDRPRFIQQMALFPTPLSDSQLTQLTTL